MTDEPLDLAIDEILRIDAPLIRCNRLYTEQYLGELSGELSHVIQTRDVTPPRYTWLVTLLVIVGLGALHTVLPYGITTAVIFTGTSAFTAAVMGLALLWRAGLRPYTSWFFVFLATALSVPGHVIWYAMDLGADGARSVFSTLFYLGTYLSLVVAVWFYGRKVESDSGALVDALMVVAAAAGLFWVVLIAPYAGVAERGLASYLLSAAYPVLDLIMLAFVLKVFFVSGERPLALTMLLLAATLVLSADLLHAYRLANDIYIPGGAMDLFWFGAYALIGSAIWHPSATHRFSMRDYHQSRPYSRLWVIGSLALVVPIVLLLIGGSDPGTLRVAAVTSIVLFVLMMYRLGLLLVEYHRQADTLKKLVRTDPLTGLANRRWLEERLRLEIARSRRTDEPFWVAFLDLDHFKLFNDTRGHAAGDALLIQLAQNWQQELRDTDLLSRIGGEEFVLVLTGLDEEECLTALQRLLQRVPSEQTCSAGLAAYQNGDDPNSLIDRADQALYQAKKQGRNRVITANSPHEV